MNTPITETMTLLDVVAEFRETEDVFRSYDQQVGTCLMCNHLFDTIGEVARKYGLDCERLLIELNSKVDS